MINYTKESDIVRRLTKIQAPGFAKYRNEWDQVNNFELETEFPLFLHIEPNYLCNFECPMCVQGIPDLKEKFGYDERLTTHDIGKIIKEGARYNCPSISFQGDNEPFLIKEIPEWFALAKNYGFQDIMVNTNGSAMTERLAKKVINSGLTRIRFSIDSIDKDTYQKIRIGGDLDKVIKNIMTFLTIRENLKSPLPMVGVNAVKMAENSAEIHNFINYWKTKVDFIVIQDFMTPDTEGEYEYLDVLDRTPTTNFRCNQPWQRLYIRGNGDVTPCCAMFSSYLKLGNIKESSLYDLWNSNLAKELRKLHKEGRYRENKTCLKCSKSGGA